MLFWNSWNQESAGRVYFNISCEKPAHTPDTPHVQPLSYKLEWTNQKHFYCFLLKPIRDNLAPGFPRALDLSPLHAQKSSGSTLVVLDLMLPFINSLRNGLTALASRRIQNMDFGFQSNLKFSLSPTFLGMCSYHLSLLSNPYYLLKSQSRALATPSTDGPDVVCVNNMDKIRSMIKRGKGSTNKEVLEVSRCKGDVTRDDSQRRFLAQYSIATLLRHCSEWSQQCSIIAMLCCPQNRRCESSRVKSP